MPSDSVWEPPKLPSEVPGVPPTANCKGNPPYSALDTAGLIDYVICVDYYVIALSLCVEGCRNLFVSPTSGVNLSHSDTDWYGYKSCTCTRVVTWLVMGV